MRPEVKTSGYLIVPLWRRTNSGISPLRRMMKPFCFGRDDKVWSGFREIFAIVVGLGFIQWVNRR
jgi:hypothetical protein